MKNSIYLVILLNTLNANAQDSLPDFSVINKGNNRIVVSWNNKFKKTNQISIQRSADSLSNFKTIMTVPDPMNRQNGYMDTKAENDRMFYRLYILVDGSNFIFSKPKKAVKEIQEFQSENEKTILEQPVKNTTVKTTDTPSPKPVTTPTTIPLNNPISEPVKNSTVKPIDNNADNKIKKISPDEFSENIPEKEDVLRFKKIKNDRIALLPVSTQNRIAKDLKVSSRPQIIVPVYRIYSAVDGSVEIILKDFQQKKYSIRLYTDDDLFLFEIKTIKAAKLKLDKSNFYRSGWFKSELYDNGKLVEKNRFYIPKDF